MAVYRAGSLFILDNLDVNGQVPVLHTVARVGTIPVDYDRQIFKFGTRLICSVPENYALVMI